MKQIVFILISIILSAVLTWLSPWYMIIVGPLLMGFLLKTRLFESFILGFLSIVFFWGTLISFYSLESNSDIFVRIAYLLPLNGSRTGIILTSLFIGGLLGGLAGLNGAFWRKSMKLK